MSNLQELQLEWMRLDPAALHSCTKLQLLDLYIFTIVVDGADDTGAGECWRALLWAVGRLTQLRHLELAQPKNVSRAPDPSCFTALTASSHLTSLELQSTMINSGFMPSRALQHMLPPGRQMPHLRQLQLHRCFADHNGGIDAADIGRIAECCPGLRHLELVDVVHSAGAVNNLTKLQPCLTSLCVGGGAFKHTSAAAAVTQLTLLKALTWGVPYVEHALPLAGVEKLTALQGLTKLKLSGWTISGDGCCLATQRGVFPMTISSVSQVCPYVLLLLKGGGEGACGFLGS